MINLSFHKKNPVTFTSVNKRYVKQKTNLLTSIYQGNKILMLVKTLWGKTELKLKKKQRNEFLNCAV